MELEMRFQPTELRVLRGDKERITGYAIVFDSPSEILADNGRRFREIVKRSAVEQPLAVGADVAMLVEHDLRSLLGTTRAGTLRYAIDDHGVRVEVDPPDTSYARDAIEMIRRGDMAGMSFRFGVPRGGDKWQNGDDGVLTRTINKMDRIAEFTITAFPAYPATDAALRSLDEFEERTRKALKLDTALDRIREADAAFEHTRK